MTDDRPNPDELLAHVQAEETRERRGRLKVFFGYAAGVGKTFAMLEAAPPSVIDWRDYLKTGLVVGVCGLIGWAISSANLSETNIVMVFLLVSKSVQDGVVTWAPLVRALSWPG